MKRGNVLEHWLSIPGYEGFYEVSDQGRVRSVPRTITFSDGRRPVRHPGRVLSPSLNRLDGYHRVVLCANGQQRSFTIHRLLMLAFVGPCPPGLEIRHLDGNPSHTVLSNLAYGTRAENTLDRVEHGTHHQAVKTHCPKNHPYDESNTYVQPSRPGARFCRACRAERNRLRKEAARGVSLSGAP